MTTTDDARAAVEELRFIRDLGSFGRLTADNACALLAHIADLQARAERAEAERDQMRQWRERILSVPAAKQIQAERQRADALAAEVAGLREALRQLIYAAQGGNADRGNADLFRWLADRLVNVHGENRNVDFVHAARERAAMLDGALPPAREALAAAPAPSKENQ